MIFLEDDAADLVVARNAEALLEIDAEAIEDVSRHRVMDFDLVRDQG